jgi:predicted GIY-YIG superfamily endonuclease
MGTKRRYNIYVVELDRTVLDEPRFARENPGHDPAKPCYYVGMTGLSPERRFANHRAGYKANRFVRRYGVRLCPRLYEEHNPLSYDDAREMEVELARMLREKGYAVWQK